MNKKSFPEDLPELIQKVLSNPTVPNNLSTIEKSYSKPHSALKPIESVFNPDI
jgi:hypothetical protein